MTSPEPDDLASDQAFDQASDLAGLAYADAVAELDAILAELDDDDVDIDVLTAHVRRASALIALCRERIVDARVEIEQILEEPDA